MPWTEHDLSRGPEDVEAAITDARPQSGLLVAPQPNVTLLVLPRDDHWVVRRAHARRVIAAFRTRDQAITRARRIADETGADVIIHDHDPEV